MSENIDHDDGLTDDEREFISTPISRMKPEAVKHGLDIRVKKAEYIWSQKSER